MLLFSSTRLGPDTLLKGSKYTSTQTNIMLVEKREKCCFEEELKRFTLTVVHKIRWAPRQ